VSKNPHYTIQFENRPDYLYAFVKGDKDSLSVSIGYWLEIAGEVRKTKSKKLLVVEDLEELAINPVEMHKLGEFLSRFKFIKIKVAFVDLQIAQNPQNRFIATVSENRGRSVKIFDNVKEAEEWLLADD
jgi:hypothetical protein